MIVGEHEGERILDYDRPENFPWMGDAFAQGPQRHEMVAFRAIFGVEHDGNQIFLLGFKVRLRTDNRLPKIENGAGIIQGYARCPALFWRGFADPGEDNF